MSQASQKCRIIGVSVRLAALLSLAIFYFYPTVSQAQEFTLNVDVRLVNVFVNVADPGGAVISGLKKEDFRLTEDGKEQTITLFERQSELPLNLALAIDSSGSVKKDMAIEKSAALRFAKTILRKQDKMGLYEFSTEVREVTLFTNSIKKIEHGLDALRGGDATALYDAIFLSSQRLATLGGRRVLILISDGGDTAKSSTYAQALEQAHRGEVMIYALIDVPVAASAGRDTGGEHALISLSEETGGKYYYISEIGLDKAFQQISEDLRTQYLLGYYPHNQTVGEEFHRIHVTIPHAAEGAFNLRYRTGYYAEAVTKDEH